MIKNTENYIFMQLNHNISVCLHLELLPFYSKTSSATIIKPKIMWALKSTEVLPSLTSIDFGTWF